MVKGWTQIMNQKLMEILNPCCILAFQTRRVKKTASRKFGGQFFNARMRCKIPGCHTFQLIMPEGPQESLSKELSMVVFRYGSPRHGEFFSHRRLAGKRRRRAAKLVNVCTVVRKKSLTPTTRAARPGSPGILPWEDRLCHSTLVRCGAVHPDR